MTKSIRSGANWYNAWIKKFLLFVRSHKDDGPAAWKALCDHFKSFKRPRLPKLIEKLTSLRRKDRNETIVDYITRAEDLLYNLSQVEEALCEQMFNLGKRSSQGVRDILCLRKVNQGN